MACAHEHPQLNTPGPVQGQQVLAHAYVHPYLGADLRCDRFWQTGHSAVFRGTLDMRTAHLRGLAEGRLQQDVEQRAHGAVGLLARALGLATHQTRAAQPARTS